MKELMDPNKVTMTSNEIAELTGKEHFHIMRDIREIIETIGTEECNPDLGSPNSIEVESDFTGSTYDSITSLGVKKVANYILSKDGVMLLITGYSVKIRMQLIKYVRELENELAKPKNPTTFLEAMKLLVKTEEGRLELEANNEQLQIESKIKDKKITEDAPHVAFSKSIEISNDDILVRDFSKLLMNDGIKMGQNKLFKWFRENDIIMKNGTEPFQNIVEKGYMRVLVRTINSPSGSKIIRTTKITGKGQVYFFKKIKKSLLKKTENL